MRLRTAHFADRLDYVMRTELLHRTCPCPGISIKASFLELVGWGCSLTSRDRIHQHDELHCYFRGCLPTEPGREPHWQWQVEPGFRGVLSRRNSGDDFGGQSGVHFENWTGNVASANSASTTVTMSAVFRLQNKRCAGAATLGSPNCSRILCRIVWAFSNLILGLRVELEHNEYDA